MLVIMSVLTTLICLGGAWGITPLHAARGGSIPLLWLRWLLIVVVVGAALFTIRGYAIVPDAILVRRLFWTTRLPRAGLRSATFDPEAMSGSLRTCGNGGAFSFTGFYWSRKLGAYRAFVTDPRRAVILRYENRTIVVSPDEPENFVRELRSDMPTTFEP